MTRPTTQPQPVLDYAAPQIARKPRPLSHLLGPALRAVAALVLVLLIGVIFNAEGIFFRFDTHRDTLRQSSVYGILACGMTLVIISGGIDLAVGSIVALSAVMFARASIHWNYSAWLSIPGAMTLAAACGMISGILVARFRMQAFIATLAMMVFARGLAKNLSGNMKISTSNAPHVGARGFADLPAIFQSIDTSVFGGNLTVVTLVFAACAAVTWVLLARHRWGRQLYAIGGNEEAARLSGVPVARAKVLAYAASGMLAGIAGICQAAQETHGDPETGMGYELTAISMVVVGGTALTGGRGGMGLTLLGVLTIGYLEKILSINAVSDDWRLMLTGAIIVVAVLAQGRR